MSKLLYFQNRGKKKEMQKLNTLSEAGVCLVVDGCFAYAGGLRCTLWSCLELTNIPAWEYIVGTFLVYYPIFSVCRNGLFLKSTSDVALDITTQANRHVRLTGCRRHWSCPDTVLYTFTNNQQVLLVSKSPSETKTSSCLNLRTILSSTILPMFSFTCVSAAKSHIPLPALASLVSARKGRCRIKGVDIVTTGCSICYSCFSTTLLL